MKNLFLSVMVSMIAPLLVHCQSFPPLDWFHLQTKQSGYPGISLQSTYDLLIKDKAPRPVVVAIIDSGVDIDHEDLVNQIWTNVDEIPENGIDDDNNGYIDDIHGWNFIGSKDGRNITHDTYEVTRIFAKLRYKYEDANPKLLTDEQKHEYKLFKKCQEEVNTKRLQATRNLTQLKSAEGYLFGLLNHVDTALDGRELTVKNLDSLEMTEDSELKTAISFLKTINDENGFLPSFQELTAGLKYQFDHQKSSYEDQLNFFYNPKYNSREIIGDNYSNPHERYYGNNDVKGGWAMHGTHVAGIIAAERNNELGLNGIASGAQIMSVRVLPDGDEHDKDVANAIKYAVENGASIINMSFGKYYEWDKEVVDEAVRYAEKNDVLLIHAAGNEAFDNDHTSHYPTRNYKSPKGFLCFKDKEADNWIEVGALSWNLDENLIAPFSNYGKESVDIFAPGMFIYSSIENDEYEILQGTSMAAPVVSGVAAVIRSYFPELTAIQIKEVILESGTKMDLEVIKPGTDELVPFQDLSKSGSLLNLESAILLAAKTKGKKKLTTEKGKEKV